MERKTKENQTSVLEGKEWYREEITKIVFRINNEIILKKIYTVATTHERILNEE